MGKATVVSICNFPIGPEFKPGLHPSDYSIPAAKDGIPSVLVINDAFHDVPLLNYKTIRVNVPAEEIARAVCEDWKIAQLQTAVGAMPGVFYVSGEYDGEDILATFPEHIQKARTEHNNWCNRLVKMADDLWQLKRSHRHIATTMINAAKYLNLENREWASDFKAEDTIRCPGCREFVDSEAAICRHCKTIINMELYESLPKVATA